VDAGNHPLAKILPVLKFADVVALEVRKLHVAWEVLSVQINGYMGPSLLSAGFFAGEGSLDL